MCPRGLGKGMRRVVSVAGSVVETFSLAAGVVLGGPDAGKDVWNPSLNLPKGAPLEVCPEIAGRRPIGQRLQKPLRHWFANWPVLHVVQPVGDQTPVTPSKQLNPRELSLRWTKTWRRPNPVRRCDYDLRFSFPLCSQTLPFLSHDARVELGRSVMPS